ncbi:B12-binding domain-containing radical SAM protein [Acidobacteriota bacterium]
MPPLGLAILGAFIRKKGYEVKILDCEALMLSHDSTVNEIIDFGPDVVGLTAVTMAIESAANLAWKIKEKADLPVVIGGVHVSAMPEDTMRRYKCFDIGVVGEGENTIIELLESLGAGSDLSRVKGILYHQNGGIAQTPPREFIEDLDSIPYPAWDLLPDLGKYYKPSVFGFKRLPAVSLITSRGCPGRCTFCYHHLFGNRYRFHSAEYVLGMIQELIEKYDAKDFVIYDDTFIVNKKRLREFCHLLLEKKLDIVWSANARVDLVNPQLLSLMKKAGCWMLAYGIESGDQEVLDNLKKKITLEQISNAIKWTRDAKITSKGYFMVGTVADTRESIEKTARFILDLPLDLITVNHFTPFPGSEDYDQIAQFSNFDNDWTKFNQHEIVFEPKNLTREEIESSVTKITRAFYLRPRVLWHFFKKLCHPSYFLMMLKGAFAFMRFAFFRDREVAQEIAVQEDHRP